MERRVSLNPQIGWVFSAGCLFILLMIATACVSVWWKFVKWCFEV